ncbi:Tum1p [Sugiyamaella lignohabitans]|uniref:Tum1p n=1 Tax=Sugiyamaella lignohabitans TaxID=796027 RepID=A0A167FZ69_9ASCO|nr:Tum1p [Sugiyamaella lignohabitans]ANB15891.1 Tum1p [Sugiyamaella lignohabitans]
MLRAFKHTNSILLNSFPVYKKLNGVLDTSPLNVPSARKATNYISSEYDADAVISYEELKSIVENPQTVDNYYILDARPGGRFAGSDPEPRPGISSGHVPGAISLPFSDLVKDGQFAPTDEISAVIKSKGIANDKPIIVMCGTGVTACVIENALKEIDGLDQPVRVYDGSWT